MFNIQPRDGAIKIKRRHTRTTFEMYKMNVGRLLVKRVHIYLQKEIKMLEIEHNNM